MMEETSKVEEFRANITKKVQYLLDKSSPHVLFRWLGFAALLALYLLRVYLLNGWFIVTYGLGIYLLNNLIGFLSPQFDPDEGEGPVLPTRDTDEYRPFSRRLPEFKFWLLATRAVAISMVMTFFRVFDIPVFWPILLLYFIVLFIITMKRQIKHMIKHKYIPFDLGKRRYATAGTPAKPSKSKD